jgi:flagellar export protein FliJ
MKTIDNLIRLARWRLDEQRRVVTDLERLRDELHAELARLAIEVEREKQVAAGNAEAARVFPAWNALAMERRETINASIAAADQRIAAAREVLGEHFAEVKRYENVAEGRARRAREDLERRQRSELDEIGLQRFRRDNQRETV